MSAIAAALIPGAGSHVQRAAVRELIHRMPERGVRPARAAVVGGVALGHAAGTVDASAAAGQPAMSRDGRIAVVLDGRIDNRDEMLSLTSLGDEGEDDARIIAEGVAARGESVLDRLVGDYAIVIADARKRCLVAARDPFGLRPLHYVQTPSGWLVASELRALAPAMASGPDEGYFAELLAGRVTSLASTPLAGVNRVPPATAVRLDDAGISASRLATIGVEEPEGRSVADLCEEFRHRLDWAVRSRLRGGRSVGVMLSGGLDSATVYLTAREADTAIDAWTIDQRPAASETAAAAASVAHIGGRHHLAPATARDFDYDDAAARWLEPPPHPSAANSAGIRRHAAAAGVPVLLSGIGGDEFFSTNDWHCADLLARGRLDQVARAWAARLTDADPVTLGSLARATLAPLVPRWARPLARRVAAGEVPPWVNRAFARRVCLDERLRQRLDTGAPTIAGRARLLDVLGGPSVFTNEEADRLATLTGTEDRAPYFDRGLAAFALRLPAPLADAAPEPKAFVRQAFAGRLPVHLRAPSPALDFSHLLADGLQRLGGAAWFSDLQLVEAGYVERAFVRNAVEQTWRSCGVMIEASPHLTGLWQVASAELCHRAIAGRRMAMATGASCTKS